jgi:hypothetical protein
MISNTNHNRHCVSKQEARALKLGEIWTVNLKITNEIYLETLYLKEEDNHMAKQIQGMTDEDRGGSTSKL